MAQFTNPSVTGSSGRGVHNATWKPLGKAQILALNCSHVPEVILEGNRGGGKTVTLLMMFLQHVGKGFGASWRGVIFRISHPALKDIKEQSKKWFKLIYPDAQYNETQSTWTFPDGEMLTFAHFASENDYWTWHGQEIPFIGWEELTSWPDDACFKSMFSCNRSSKPGIPKMIRSTTNPYGLGKTWVKERYGLPTMRWKVQTGLTDPETGGALPDRLALNFRQEDNTALLDADPEYMNKVRASAKNPEMLKAWLDGDWDAAVGGMFDDLFRPDIHVVTPFLLNPKQWRLDRALDWGSAAPYSFGIYAEARESCVVKTPMGVEQMFLKGDVIRIREDYGWNGKPNKGTKLPPEVQAKRFRELEDTWGIHHLVQPGPAGVDIWSTAKGPALHSHYAKRGVRFIPAYVGAGSRVAGMQEIRTRLFNANPLDIDGNTLPREKPGLFFFDGQNPQMLRLLIGAVPCEKNPDDLDENYEDHPIDELRYKLFTKKRTSTQHAA